jgi:hypothetical protein
MQRQCIAAADGQAGCVARRPEGADPPRHYIMIQNIRSIESSYMR